MIQKAYIEEFLEYQITHKKAFQDWLILENNEREDLISKLIGEIEDKQELQFVMLIIDYKIKCDAFFNLFTEHGADEDTIDMCLRSHKNELQLISNKIKELKEQLEK